MEENITGKEQLNFWTIKDYFRNFFMLGIKVPIWILQKLLFFIPLKPRRIIIYSLKQSGYSCNLKYLTEYFNHSCTDNFELLWIVKNEFALHHLQQREIPVAALHSWRHFLYRIRSGIVITNDEFYPIFLKRKGQIYVNTWHGGINYKQIGYSGIGFTNSIQRLIYQLNNPQPEIFVSGSRSFTESTAVAFGFPESIFLPSGLPRNDILFHSTTDQQGKTKKVLHIPESENILLYAPTFRKGKSKPQGELNYDRLAMILSTKFGGVWKILVRQHYFVSDTKGTDRQSDKVIDVSKYEDMQELIQISDCMISDYSSCMWDFSFTGRPCFVYAEDIQSYSVNDRSFSIPPSEWPYVLCQNEEELYKKILDFDIKSYQKKVELHHQQMGSYESGNACEQLTCTIQMKMKGLDLT